jgi:hypothetical protein
VWPPIPPISALIALIVTRIISQSHDLSFKIFPISDRGYKTELKTA